MKQFKTVVRKVPFEMIAFGAGEVAQQLGTSAVLLEG